MLHTVAMAGTCGRAVRAPLFMLHACGHTAQRWLPSWHAAPRLQTGAPPPCPGLVSNAPTHAAARGVPQGNGVQRLPVSLPLRLRSLRAL